MNMFLKYTIILLTSFTGIGISFLYFYKINGKVVSYLREKGPRTVRNYLLKRRAKRIEQQIVDGVDMLANCLKAGLSLQQALSMVAMDGPAPINEEMAFVINQVKIGKSLEDALIEWKERVRIDDINILVESILVLRQTGGNLVETFSSIADTVRERQMVSGKIRVLTTQGLSQAVVIIALPFLLSAGLFFVARWYIEPLFTTGIGWALVAVMLGLQTLGALWMRKIITIRV